MLPMHSAPSSCPDLTRRQLINWCLRSTGFRWFWTSSFGSSGITRRPRASSTCRHTTLAAAVQKRLRSYRRDARVVLDALSVLGETDSELLAAVTGLDEATLSIAIHDAVSSTLLVPASTPLGVTWRHPLMC